MSRVGRKARRDEELKALRRELTKLQGRVALMEARLFAIAPTIYPYENEPVNREVGHEKYAGEGML